MRTRQREASGLIPARPTLSPCVPRQARVRRVTLARRGTQTVFGEGARHAELLIVGEQPGNDEDLSGRPFVGPAGKLLDRAVEDAGIDRAAVYVTNVVKHVKWESRGKRRIHQRPNAAEIAACRPWLDAEIALVKPFAILCLGATAARALFGRQFKVTAHRGELISSDAQAPSSIEHRPCGAHFAGRVVAPIHAMIERPPLPDFPRPPDPIDKPPPDIKPVPPPDIPPPRPPDIPVLERGTLSPPRRLRTSVPLDDQFHVATAFLETLACKRTGWRTQSFR